MDYFQYRNHEAYCEDIPLAKLAKDFGTPLYVYSRSTIIRHCAEFLRAFADYPCMPCFAVKANSNIAYLKEIAGCGFGADIVSGGELERSLLAGFAPDKIVFSGVGKTNEELRRGLEVGIYCFNVESEDELQRLRELAADMGRVAPISLRINPNIDAKTNPKISTGLYGTKFGIDEPTAFRLVDVALKSPSLRLLGLSCHIGSQILELDPLAQAARQMTKLVKQAMAAGARLEFIGMGGGLGIRYAKEIPPTLDAYAKALLSEVSQTGLRLIVEPGRVIAGNTGIFLSRVISVKQTPERNFAVIDGSMSELMRPALYGSYHEICPSKEALQTAECLTYDVVGPVCETTDILGQGRSLPVLAPGDLVFLRSCGAYGASMSSNYNTRPKAAEVLVDGASARMVRLRDELTDLWAKERY